MARLFVLLFLLVVMSSNVLGQDVNFNASNKDFTVIGNRSLVGASPKTHFLNSLINEGRNLQLNGLPTFDVKDSVIGDFNADGILDVASISSEVTLNGQGSLILLFGIGDGSFNLPKVFPTTKKPSAIASADIDGDGINDIAIAENGLVEVFSGFLINTGIQTSRDRIGDPNANPQGNGLLIFGNIATSIAFARLDADSVPDIVVLEANTFSGQVEVFLTNSNNGSFSLTANFTFSTVGQVSTSLGCQKALAIANTNLPDPQTSAIDNDLDIIIATSAGIEIFENAPPNFVSQPILSVNRHITQIQVVDVNRDTKPDIIALAPDTSSVIVIGTVSKGYDVPLEFPCTNNPITFTALNSGRSGQIDLAVVGSDSTTNLSNVVLLQGTRFGTFPTITTLATNLTVSPSTLLPSRLDRSSSADDLLMASRSNPSIKTLTGGLLLLSNRLNYQPIPQQVITNMQAIDFDGFGGLNDLLIIEQNQGVVVLALNNLSNIRTIVARDLFTNGKQIVTSATTFRDSSTGSNNLAISLVTNPDQANGTGLIITGFGDSTPLPAFRQFVATPGITNLMSGDFNSDLFDDLAYIDSITNSVAVVINDGRNSFVNTTIRETGGFIPVSAVLLDANDDDRLDMAVVNQGIASQGNQSLVTILYGDGQGGFQPNGSLLQVPNFALSIVGGNMAISTSLNGNRQVVDFNQDGYPDLAVVSTGSSILAGLNDAASVTVLLNRPDSPGQFTVQPPIPLKDLTANTSLQMLAKMGGTGMVSGRFGDGSGGGVARGGANRSFSVADFNADGSQDLVVSGTAIMNGMNLRSSMYLLGNGTGSNFRIARPQRIIPYLNADPNSLDADTFVASSAVSFSGTNLPPDVVHMSVNGRVWVDTNRSQIINRAPTVTIRREDLNAPIGQGRKAIITIGQTLIIPVTGFDADNDPLTFRLVPTPTGEQPPEFVTIKSISNTTAQVIIDTSRVKSPNTLTNRIAVEVSDSSSGGQGGRQPLTSRAYFTLLIRPNSAPTIAPIANQTIIAGQTSTVKLSISNADSKQLTITSSCDKGNFVKVMGTSLSLSPQASDIGTSNCTVTVKDEFGLSSSIIFTVIVQASTPTISPIPDQIVKPGEPKVINITASDPSGSNGLKLNIVTSPSFVTINDSGTGKATLVIAPTITDSQGGRVTVQVTNSFGVTATTSFNIQIAKAVVITSATYSKPNLFIAGSGFSGSSLLIQVNGKDVSVALTKQFDSSLTLVGTKKKLNLKVGTNQINIIVDGITSNSFVFTF